MLYNNCRRIVVIDVWQVNQIVIALSPVSCLLEVGIDRDIGDGRDSCISLKIWQLYLMPNIWQKQDFGKYWVDQEHQLHCCGLQSREILRR